MFIMMDMPWRSPTSVQVSTDSGVYSTASHSTDSLIEHMNELVMYDMAFYVYCILQFIAGTITIIIMTINL